MNLSTTKPRLFGSIGIVFGMVSMAVAFLSPWIIASIDPPAKPIEEVAVDFAIRMAEAAKKKINGEAGAPAIQQTKNPSRFLFPTIIIAGMIAAGLGVAGSIRSEDRFLSGTAITLGVGAAVVQWSFLMAGALILILVLLVVMALLTGGA